MAKGNTNRVKKRGMECPKEMPKRQRYPTKKMELYQAAPGSPQGDEAGLFVFLTFEDGYSAKIFKVSDILNKDDKAITCFQDLKPGEQILAKWSDGKFYSATVGYIGSADTADKKMHTKENLKKRAAAAHRFYSLQSSSQSSPPSRQQQQPPSIPTSPPPQQQQRQSPPIPTSPPPWQQHQSPPIPTSAPPWQQHQSPPIPTSAPPPQQRQSAPIPTSPPPWQQRQSPPIPTSAPPRQQHQSPPIPTSAPPRQQHQSPPILTSPPPGQQHQPPTPIHSPSSMSQDLSNHSHYAQFLYQDHTTWPMPSVQAQPVFLELGSTTDPNSSKHTAKDSFLEMLKCGRPDVDTEENNTTDCDNSTSSASTDIIERDPLPEFGEPISWKPCAACKTEVEKLMVEKEKLQDLLCSISGEELQALRGFLDKVGEAQLQTGPFSSPKIKSGKREHFQDSGLYLSSTRLTAIHGEARQDCLRLFHLLFEEFFTSEECQNAVAFGKHGKVPDGKTSLDRKKVDGILTYVMNCGTLAGWTPVEKTRVKKALINKCRIRAAKTF